jgi:hypothetical protein
MNVESVLHPADHVVIESPALFGCAEHDLGLWDYRQANTHESVSLTDKGNELHEHLPRGPTCGSRWGPREMDASPPPMD